LIGTQLSHFRITALLGEGGMGAVYRAEDSRLGREVAIKVLPEAVSENPERLARFEREAQVVASLNHPNICALYDVGESKSKSGGTIHYLVMELVEGPTLADRMAQGPIPADEAAALARQIAEALEVAHEQSIIHRDLKPANVKLTTEGQVKVLDFGLAKAFEPATGSQPGLSMSPTLTAQMTQAGVILGTAAYMSPEQAKGIEADRRADVWSFGVLLHEMLTGRRLFAGDSVSDTLAAVLRDPIDGSGLPEDLHPAVRTLIARCLDRDPKSRLRDIGEARVALSSLDRDASSSILGSFGQPVSDETAVSTPSRLPWIVATLATTVAVSLGVLSTTRETPPPRLVRSSIAIPKTLSPNTGTGLSLSPDGTRVAFIASGESGQSGVWVHSLSTGQHELLAGTDGATYPFWSPDGRHLGFFANGSLKRIPSSGGPSQALSTAIDPRGGSWSETDQIVFAPDFRSGLSSVSASGGETTAVTTLDSQSGESNHRFPLVLPGGDKVLFLAQRAEGGTRTDESTIEVLSLASGEQIQLLRANSSMAWSPTGHILFWDANQLLARPFDLSKLELGDGTSVIADEIAYSINEFASFSISSDGTLVSESGYGTGGTQPMHLQWLDRDGLPIGDPGTADYYDQINLNPDGKRLAFSLAGASIWVRDLQRGTNMRVSFAQGDHYTPLWSPDGKWLAYGTNHSHPTEIVRRLASGRGEEESLLVLQQLAQLSDWSPDGTRLLFQQITPSNDLDVMQLNLETGSAETLVSTPYVDTNARYSPDGRWVTYESTESGATEVYAISLDGAGGKYLVSTGGGTFARWSPLGNEIFYRNPTGTTLFAVDVAYKNGLEIGVPRVLATTTFAAEQNYAIAPDAQSFLVSILDADSKVDHFDLVQNWTWLLEDN
jgi:serine/threonine protein kinase